LAGKYISFRDVLWIFIKCLKIKDSDQKKMSINVYMVKCVSRLYEIIPPFLLGRFANLESIAIFRVAYSLIRFSYNVLGNINSYLTVKFPQIEKNNHKVFYQKYVLAIKGMFKINLLTNLASLLGGLVLIKYFYGQQYTLSMNPFFLMLIANVFLLPLQMVVGPVCYTLRKTHYLSYAVIASSICMTLVMVLSAKYGALSGAFGVIAWQMVFAVLAGVIHGFLKWQSLKP
jgi:O-antigen/teichoic acid export membrane protein